MQGEFCTKFTLHFVLKKLGDSFAALSGCEDLLAENEATWEVIGALPERALLLVGRSAVAVQISVPFSEFLVGEVREGVFVELFVPALVFFIAGE